MNDFTVNIIDDDPAVLQSLKSMFDTDSTDVRTFRSANDFILDGLSLHACCLILDLRMPGMTGIELLDWLKSNHIEIPVIVLSGHGDIPAVVESMQRGAVDFIEKPADPARLNDKVQLLRQMSQDQIIARAKRQQTSDRFATITNRENEVLDLLTQGLSSKQIAAKLGISRRTVETHRTHLLAKTHAPNVASLIHLWMSLTGLPKMN